MKRTLLSLALVALAGTATAAPQVVEAIVIRVGDRGYADADVGQR